MSWQSRCKTKMWNAASKSLPWSAVDHCKLPDAVLLSYLLSTDTSGPCPVQDSLQCYGGQPISHPPILYVRGGTSCRALPLHARHAYLGKPSDRAPQCEHVTALLLTSHISSRLKLLCDHLYSTEQLCCSQSGARHTIKEAVLCTAKKLCPHLHRLLLALSSNRGPLEHRISSRLQASDGISGSVPAYSKVAAY